jgi:hypothetical protein
MDTFFSFENQCYPPALSLSGEMRSGEKSHLVQILEKLVPDPCQPQQCHGIGIDGAVLVHNLKPMPGLGSFKEYFLRQVSQHILGTAERLKSTRVDFVWDLYLEASTKVSTRTSRGTETRRQGLPTSASGKRSAVKNIWHFLFARTGIKYFVSGKLPGNWEDYLKNASNKRELFKFLAEQCVSGLQLLQIVTNVEDVITASDPGISALRGVACGSREEADGRVILHIRDMMKSGFTSILVVSTDTDVVVLCV